MAITRKLLNKNVVRVVGTLTDVDLREGDAKNGKHYVSGTVNIKSNEKVISMHFFSNQMTQQNTVSKLYTTYLNLPNLIGSRVEASGELDESKIYSGGTLRKGNVVNVKFINALLTGDTTADVAEFTVEGFIANGLSDIYAEDGATVIAHQLVIGQTNYNNTMAKLIRLSVDPKNVQAVAKLQKDFGARTTARLSGDLDFTIETITSLETNDFGKDDVKTYQRNIKKYLINSGKVIIDEALCYTDAEINELMAGSQADDERVINRFSSTETAIKPGNVTTMPKSAAGPKLI